MRLRPRAAVLASIALLCALPAGAQLPDLRPIPESGFSSSSDEVRSVLEDHVAGLQRLVRENAIPEDLAEAYGEAGRLFFAYQLVDAAEAAFANARDLNPPDPRWSYFLGLLHLEAREFDDAIEAFESVLESLPDDLATLIRLAGVHLEAEDLDAARAAYERARQIDPEAAATLAGLGRIALMEDRVDDAIPLLEAAVERQPQATRLHFLLARAHRRAGDEPAARRHAEAAGSGEVAFPESLMQELAMVAESAAFHLSTGDRAASLGRYGFAEEAYKRALEIDPDDAKAHRALGALHETRGDGAAALESYRRASELDPDNVFAAFALGRLEVARGDRETGLRSLERALELDPGFEQARVELARALLSSRPERSLELFDETLVTNPQSRAALLGRARALEAAGRPAEAVAALESLVDQLPDDPGPRLNLANLCIRTGETERGRRLLEELAASDTVSPDIRALAYFNLGLQLERDGDGAGARASLLAALSQDPDLGDARFQLATMLAREKSYDEAVVLYREVIERDPGHSQARLAEATALLLSGRAAEARRRLEEGVAARPDDVALSHTLARLLVSCRTPEVCDGPRALELAQEVFQRHPTFEHGETLAMALVAAGRVGPANEWLRQLLAEAERAGDEAWIARLRRAIDDSERRVQQDGAP